MAVLRREVRGGSASLDDALERHRDKLSRAHRVRSSAHLIAMVDAVGFCFAFTGEASYPVPACFDHLSTNDDGKTVESAHSSFNHLAEANAFLRASGAGLVTSRIGIGETPRTTDSSCERAAGSMEPDRTLPQLKLATYLAAPSSTAPR